MEKVITPIASLFIIYPLLVISAWFFFKWETQVKILISIPVIIIAILLVSFISFASISAVKSNEDSRNMEKISNICNEQCKDVVYPDDAACFNKCTASHGIEYKRSYGPPATILPTQSTIY